MIQSIFNRISKYALEDWAVILQGISGIPSHSGSLSVSCVENFANIELETIDIDNPLFDVIVKLANDSNLPIFELNQELQKICDYKNSDLQRAKRIWRVIALEEVLENLNTEPLYGLISLSEFWSSWGWPTDAPPSMLTNTKPSSERDYHSEKKYNFIIHEHKEWVRNEISSLI